VVAVNKTFSSNFEEEANRFILKYNSFALDKELQPW